jgi:hypothetical protein
MKADMAADMKADTAVDMKADMEPLTRSSDSARWRYSPHGSRIQIAKQTAAIIEDKSKHPQAVVGAWLKAT